MSLHSYLRNKTRQPPFLWRLGLGIIGVGVVLALAIQGTLAGNLTLVEGDRGPLVEQQQLLDRLVEQGQWSDLWWGIPKSMWLGVSAGPAILALFTGVCWFAFAVQAGQPRANNGVRPWLCVLAVGAGVLSIWPTLFLGHWQEEVWGLSLTKDLVDGLRFFLLGVGLREELCKLLLFLPLVPLIVRRGSPHEALIVAACVGLGFAIEENIGYFWGAAGQSVPRLLTANFLHMAWTGLCGLAVCRAVWNPRECAAEAGAIVLVAIILHGLYDSVIVLPALEEFAIGAMIIYVLLAYQFFRELRQGWAPRGEAVSLAATFIAAVSLVFTVTFAYQSAISDFETAIDLVAQPAVASGVMVYLFLKEMPESLVGA